jgi:asparagine synthase (glutamine-hydrolysing)
LNKYKKDSLNLINGGYAFVYICDDKILAVRDRLGVKPLYYTIYNDDIIIASEIKAILAYGKETIVDKDGLCELLGMGPSNSVGKTIYKDIYEIPPGHYLEFDGRKIKIEKYYEINQYKLEITYSDAVRRVNKMVRESIINNIPSDNKVSCLLSGGLDSSIVSTVVSEKIGPINTYLIDYEDNDKDFIPNSYEITRDKDYARLVAADIKSNHNELTIDNQTLFDNIKKAVDYRDSPGMTDIDSSLIYLSSKIKDKVCLTGECADEIFAGYSWYYEKSENKYGFPWIKSLDFKENLLNDKYKLNLKEYVIKEYNKAINGNKLNHKELCYINIKYCMTNLLNRNDRMTMSSSLEAKAPYCDYKLIELLYNLPLSYKYRLKTEKKLLRDSFKKTVIKDVIERKKSPYPKSRSKEYEYKVKEELLNIINGDSILNELFNKEKLIEFINDPNEMEQPWYGQLMRKTSFLAYLYQIDYWYKKYKIRIDIVG